MTPTAANDSESCPPNAQSRRRSCPPELLAPAGDFECLRAAVENGADAVYFGLEDGFNARARATNFSLHRLPEVLDFLHRRCVRGYITLNTLAFTDELDRLENAGRQLADCGADAVLVQDLGVARLLRESCPGLEIHASTQMSLTDAGCIEEVRDLGIRRVVLPRELSLAEIRTVAAMTDMPLEVFVHGALCVAYSGQCLTSESLGGRSANRGQCAQACRLPYELICDGTEVDLGNRRYLLSPQDLGAYDLIGELIDAGVCSLKIEGRLKSAEYVANTVSHYRRAIDEAVRGSKAEFTAAEIHDLEMSFSRGLSPGWLQGCDHKMLVPAESSSKRGVLVGTIVASEDDAVTAECSTDVFPGDGIVFEGDREAGTEQGGRIFEVIPVSGHAGLRKLTFRRQSLRSNLLKPGLRIWKTDDPRLSKRLRATFRGPDAGRRVPLHVEVTAEVGQPLRAKALAENGATAQFVGDTPLPAARRHPASEQLFREQFGRLGGSVYSLGRLNCRIHGEPMVPLSVIGAARRQLLHSLDTSGVTVARNRTAAPVLPSLRASLRLRESKVGLTGAAPEIHVLCRTPRQISDLLQLPEAQEGGSCRPATVYADFADIREYRKVIRLCRDAGVPCAPAVPRIVKPGEIGIFRAMLKAEPDCVLVRNLSALRFFRDHGVPCIADFSFNVTNELTADYLSGKGCERITAAYDLNRDQLLEMTASMSVAQLEVVIHQHMPMFHMEHCVFCSVLSEGTDKTNCGRPCDHHTVHLKDRAGKRHLLTADTGCRNTLFNASAQSGAEAVPDLLTRQVRHFRIEFLEDNANRMQHTIRLYRQLLDGHVTGREVWQKLRADNRVGVTRGTLEAGRNPLEII